MSNRIACFFVVVLTFVTAPALAAPREARVPLHGGKLRRADLSAALCRELNLPAISFDCGEIDVDGVGGSRFVTGINESLGDACRVRIAGDAIVLNLDPGELPDSCRATKKAVRVFTGVVAPEATAKQRAYYGLWTPRKLDTSRPLVVLVHGLDCDRLNWEPMARLLQADGRQVAVYTYPSDQPIADSAADLGAKLAELRLRTPGLAYDLICHSMGGLVAREYVECEGYRGGVERLIMLGTPNRGSRWAGYRLALEVDEHYGLWRHVPEWSPSWMITDGLGEAGSDLKPTSDFLELLNARPRRAGVRYTIVAGNQNPARRMAANCLEETADWIPRRVAKWWGFRHGKRKLENTAGRMRQRGGSDGPVSVESCRLEGVDDFVIVAADHASLMYPVGDRPPAAWDTIRARLNP